MFDSNDIPYFLFDGSLLEVIVRIGLSYVMFLLKEYLRNFHLVVGKLMRWTQTNNQLYMFLNFLSILKKERIGCKGTP